MAPRKETRPSQNKNYRFTRGFGPLSPLRISDNSRVGTRRARTDRDGTSSTSRSQGGSIRRVQRHRNGYNTRMSMAEDGTVSNADLVMQLDTNFISHSWTPPHYDPSVGHQVMQNQAASMNNPLSAAVTQSANTPTYSAPNHMINKPVGGTANTMTKSESRFVVSNKEKKAIKAMVSNPQLQAVLAGGKVDEETKGQQQKDLSSA